MMIMHISTLIHSLNPKKIHELTAFILFDMNRFRSTANLTSFTLDFEVEQSRVGTVTGPAVGDFRPIRRVVSVFIVCISVTV